MFSYQDAFRGTTLYPIGDIVICCIFFVFTAVILISLWCVRKRKHTEGRKIIGVAYVLSLLSLLIYYFLGFTMLLLYEFNTVSVYDLVKLQIANGIFEYVAIFLILVVIVYSINNTLRQRLSKNSALLRIASGTILTIMGGHTFVMIVIQSYIYEKMYETGALLERVLRILDLTYSILYLLCVIGFGALSAFTIVSMRAERILNTSLLVWFSVLYASLFIWVLLRTTLAVCLVIVFLKAQLISALEYLQTIFMSLAYAILLVIAHHNAWNSEIADGDPTLLSQEPPFPEYAPIPIPQSQYHFNNHSGQPALYYNALAELNAQKNDSTPIELHVQKNYGAPVELHTQSNYGAPIELNAGAQTPVSEVR